MLPRVDQITTNGTQVDELAESCMTQITQVTANQWPGDRIGNPHNSSLHEEASELMHTHLRPHVVKLLKDLEDLESNEQVSNDSHIDQWQKKHDEVETAIEFEEQYSKIFSTGVGEGPVMGEDESLLEGQYWNQAVRELVGLPALEQTEAATSESG